MTAKEVDEDDLMDMVEDAGKIRTKMAKLQIKKMMLFRKHIDPEKMEQVRSQLKDRMREHMQSRDGEGGRRPEGSGRDGQGMSGRRRPGTEGGHQRKGGDQDQPEEQPKE